MVVGLYAMYRWMLFLNDDMEWVSYRPADVLAQVQTNGHTWRAVVTLPGVRLHSDEYGSEDRAKHACEQAVFLYLAGKSEVDRAERSRRTRDEH